MPIVSGLLNDPKQPYLLVTVLKVQFVLEGKSKSESYYQFLISRLVQPYERVWWYHVASLLTARRTFLSWKWWILSCRPSPVRLLSWSTNSKVGRPLRLQPSTFHFTVNFFITSGLHSVSPHTMFEVLQVLLTDEGRQSSVTIPRCLKMDFLARRAVHGFRSIRLHSTTFLRRRYLFLTVHSKQQNKLPNLKMLISKV